MIAFDGGTIQVADPFHAFVWAGVITHDIAKADKVVTTIRLGIGNDRIERFEISVYIAENGEAHGGVAAILGDDGAGL